MKHTLTTTQRIDGKRLYLNYEPTSNNKVCISGMIPKDKQYTKTVSIEEARKSYRFNLSYGWSPCSLLPSK